MSRRAYAIRVKIADSCIKLSFARPNTVTVELRAFRYINLKLYQIFV